MIKMIQFPIFYLLLSSVVGQSLSNVVKASILSIAANRERFRKGKEKKEKNKNLINNQLVWTDCGKKWTLTVFDQNRINW